MSRVGADVEQLQKLGDDLKLKRGNIDEIISAVRSALGNTVWGGPRTRRVRERMAVIVRAGARTDARGVRRGRHAVQDAGDRVAQRGPGGGVAPLPPPEIPHPARRPVTRCPRGPGRRSAPTPYQVGARKLAPTIRAVQKLEFTVEPFVEGHPGPHVRAAVDAATAAGVDVEFGPFGSSFQADDHAMPDPRRGRHQGRVRERRHPRVVARSAAGGRE